MGDTLTRRQVAKLFNCSTTTIRKLGWQGKLVGTLEDRGPGKEPAWVYRKTDVDALAETFVIDLERAKRKRRSVIAVNTKAATVRAMAAIKRLANERGCRPEEVPFEEICIAAKAGPTFVLRALECFGKTGGEVLREIEAQKEKRELDRIDAQRRRIAMRYENMDHEARMAHDRSLADDRARRETRPVLERQAMAEIARAEAEREKAKASGRVETVRAVESVVEKMGETLDKASKAFG